MFATILYFPMFCQFSVFCPWGVKINTLLTPQMEETSYLYGVNIQQSENNGKSLWQRQEARTKISLKPAIPAF